MLYRDMVNERLNLVELSDGDLLVHARQLACAERRATARLVAALAEIDARQLYLGEGYSSLFTYCTQALHFSENAAYGRIAAARAARRFPVILGMLDDGSLNLTTVGLLTPHLTDENHHAVLEAARHKSKRDVEHQVAALHPRPPIAASVRKVPAARPFVPPAPAAIGEAPAAVQSVDGNRDAPLPHTPSHRAVVAPLAPERYKVQFTVSRETYEKLRRVQDLLRHSLPSGDPAAVFDRALTVLLADLEKQKLAATARGRRPRATVPKSRHIPAAVRRAVWARDGGRCAFVGAQGRCTETGFLEFHHVVPFAQGGPATVENIEVRCAAHNRYEAELSFGLTAPSFARESGVPYPAGELGPDPVHLQFNVR